MRRKIVCFLTAFVLLLVASSTPISANDKIALNDTREDSKSIVYSTADPNVFIIDKGVSIVNVDNLLHDANCDPADFHFDSDTVEVHTVVTEQWPLYSTFATASCSPGKHTDVFVTDTKSSSITHLPKINHPCYCTWLITTYWKCDNCKTTGTEKTSCLFYCEGINLN